MKVLIITGGYIDTVPMVQYMESRSWDYLISADSGLDFCKKANILPDCILGDFDSVSPSVLEEFERNYSDRIKRFPPEKDETDTELAMSEAIAAGADEITILGATGSRVDHLLGSIQLLKKALGLGIDCCIVDANNRIRMTDSTFRLSRASQFGTFVSCIPFSPEVRGLTLRGFAYNVTDFTMTSGTARGVSNEIVSDEAVITLEDGILLIIESKD